jgi:hypothetical protein
MQHSCVHYVVWHRPDETRLCSTLLMASHPESCLFRLIINNTIFCLIKTALVQSLTVAEIINGKIEIFSKHQRIVLNIY